MSGLRLGLLVAMFVAMACAWTHDAARAAFTGPVEFAAGTSPFAVAVGDFDGDARDDLAVANFNSDDVSILIGNGSGDFAPAPVARIRVGGGPAALAVADFDGDGDPDLAVANSRTDDLSILLGGPGGSFTPAPGSPIAVGNSPFAVAAGDFNGDHDPDLAVADELDSQVTVLLGGTGASFAPAPGSPYATGRFPFSVAVADFNADADPDLAIANLGSNDVSILVGGPGGTFAPAPGGPVPAGDGPRSIAAGDFNHDSDPDLAVANGVSDDVTILLGGAGTAFIPAGAPVRAGHSPAGITAGDLNGDEEPDLALANIGSNDITILLGTGGGHFAEPAYESPLPGDWNPTAIAVRDLSGDGAADIIVANYVSDNVSVLFGGATPSFTRVPGALPIAAGSVLSMASADFNGDADPDFAVTSSDVDNVVVYLGGGGLSFTASPGSPFATGARPFSVIAGDFDGDGRRDLAIANLDGDSVSVLLGNGLGGFTPSAGGPFSTGRRPFALAAGDLNGDGNLDVAAVNSEENTVSILLGDGHGALRETGSRIPVGVAPYGIAAGDFDRDGDLDLAVANFTSNNISILVGDGHGAFTPAPARYPTGLGPLAVVTGDFNRDGDLDLAVGNPDSNDVSVFAGGPGATFAEVEGSPFAAGVLPYTIAIADVNDDSDADLVIANGGDYPPARGVSVLLGGPGASFFPGAGFSPPEGTKPYAIVAGDFDGDSEPDVAVANRGSNDVWILRGGTDDNTGARDCTISGTNRADVLVGTPGDDVICGGNGGDRISGLGGRDVLIGGNGADVLVGGSGADVLIGGNGKDSLDARDGGIANDTLDGGHGRDRCESDLGDGERSCP